MSLSPLPDLQDGRRRRLVLAASTGGHLAQLVRLAPGLGASDDSLWVTFRNPQSESLLQGRDVLFVPYIRPRDAKSIARAFLEILPRIRRGSYAAAVSTGAAVALAALPAARLAGVPSLYIESVSRLQGPSLSGRIIAALRFAEMRSQHPGWAGGRWGVHPSVLSTYRPQALSGVTPGKPSLFVTLGTIRGYEFHSLIDRIMQLGLADERTVWQLGDTRPRRHLPGRVVAELPSAEFDRLTAQADVVITHAGVGTVLQLLDRGIAPVVVPRRRARGEHVDDHQHQLVQLLADAGVGFAVEVDDLTADVVATAAATGVQRLTA
ncbi:glycosyltransferase [Blastococcus sp. KM273129]|uniref:glycosyltransferase n=1 Tax=Blastococcus sp. KM273129 TaxID=2570315 RepID=UPI001F2BC623|nr:glycosyltransferase [Blastococcus sp. KM273129]MCF6736931.1 glycosyltransferase [Blastococcus sp. KM273129]